MLQAIEDEGVPCPSRAWAGYASVVAMKSTFQEIAITMLADTNMEVSIAREI